MWCCWLVWSLCEPSCSDMVLICSLVLDLFPSEIVFVQFAANSGWVSGSGTESPSSSSWCCKGRWHSWPNTAHSPPPSQGARTIQCKEREEQAQGCSLSLFFWHGCFSMFQIHSGFELRCGFLLELSSQFRCAKSLSVVLLFFHFPCSRFPDCFVWSFIFWEWTQVQTKRTVSGWYMRPRFCFSTLQSVWWRIEQLMWSIMTRTNWLMACTTLESQVGQLPIYQLLWTVSLSVTNMQHHVKHCPKILWLNPHMGLYRNCKKDTDTL